ncbi:MAG: hypothetical protein IKB71_07525 [Lentisphaeria bacterium]|nr:hypothetical protein [Lentisphaeria bacterium]
MKEIFLMIVKFHLILSSYLILYFMLYAIHKLGFRQFLKDLIHDKYMFGIILIFLFVPVQVVFIAMRQAGKDIKNVFDRIGEVMEDE